MNFTPREKKLLIFTGILLVLVVYFMLFLKPLLSDITDLKNEIATDRQNYDMNSLYKEKTKTMEGTLKALGQRMKLLRKELPTVLNSDEMLIVVRDLAKSSGIQLESLSFGENQAFKIKKTKISEADGQTQEAAGNEEAVYDKKEIITDGKLKEILKDLGISQISGKAGKNNNISDGKGYFKDLKIAALGKNIQLEKFIYGIENLKNKTAINNIKITNQAGGNLSINMSVSFYGLFDSGASTDNALDTGNWVPEASANKDNLFEAYKGFPGELSQGTAAKAPLNVKTEKDAAIQKKYDFNFTVLPYGNNMAPPTVAMICRTLLKNSNSGIPSVYGDNKATEKADLFIEEKGGKFFCKYRTTQEAYPDTSFTKLSEFKPEARDINAIIISSQRKYAEDNSGLLLNVTNNSSKNLNIEVKYDDENKPRVNINKQSGNITVNYTK